MQFREITQQTQARTVSDLETTEGKGREGEKENWAGQQGTVLREFTGGGGNWLLPWRSGVLMDY